MLVTKWGGLPQGCSPMSSRPGSHRRIDLPSPPTSMSLVGKHFVEGYVEIWHLWCEFLSSQALSHCLIISKCVLLPASGSAGRPIGSPVVGFDSIRRQLIYFITRTSFFSGRWAYIPGLTYIESTGGPVSFILSKYCPLSNLTSSVLLDPWFLR